MAKRGITVHSDYDKSKRWCLVIEKKRGKLTLDEVREAAREWELDFYLLLLDCFHEGDDIQNYDTSLEGDYAVLYRTDLFYKEGEN